MAIGVMSLPTFGPFDLVIGMLLIVFSGILIEQLVYFISWKLQRSTFGVATIFAPILTSAPELSVFLIALYLENAAVAWGTIVAQPFMAATIIYPVLVLTTFISRYAGRRQYIMPRVDKSVAHPLIVFTIPLIPILFLHPERYSILGRVYGLILLLGYIIYVKKLLKVEKIEKLESKFWLRNYILQTVIAVLAIYLGGEYMVHGIIELGTVFNIDQTALTVILVPIATVIPESIVGLIFLAKGKDDEGVGSVIGEKALYGTFYPGVAMTLGIYTLQPAAVMALVIAVVVSAVEILVVRKFGIFGASAPLGLLAYIYYIKMFIT